MAEPTKEERLAEFFTRLEALPPASSQDEALELIRITLNAVEDELTDVPNQPTNWQTDGRMYPPEEDNARDVPGRSDIIRFRNKAHNTYVRKNGAIEIRSLKGNVLFRKNGSDGQGVDLKD